MYKYLLLVLILFFYVKDLPAQCLDHDSLHNRLILLRDSKMLTPHNELVELRAYESRIHKCTYKNDSTHVFLLQRIAKLFSAQGDYIRAIEYNKRSITILLENLDKPSTKPSQLIYGYYTIADLYGRLNKIAEKFRYFDSCIVVAQRMKIVDIHSLYPLWQKVQHLFTIGEYDLCITFASMGESLSRRYVPEEGTKQYGNSSDYSNYFLSYKLNALISLERYDEAEKVLIKKLGEWKKEQSSRFIGALYEQLATVQIAKKDTTAGIAKLKQAFLFNSKAGETVNCKVNMDNLGFYTYQVTKDSRLALSYYKKALRFHDNTARDSVNSVNIYNHIAGLYVDRGQFDSAQYYFQCAFDQIKKGTDEREVLDNPLNVFVQQQQVKYLIELFMDKGEAFFKEYQATGKMTALDDAIRIYHLTDLLIERTKESQSEMKSKLFWRKHTHRFYERAIAASVSANRVNDAFYFFERSRSILLYDQLNEQSWLGENEILKQNQLAIKLEEMQKNLAKYNPASHQHAALQERWYVLKQEHLKLQERIKIKNPLYYQNYLDTTFTTLRDVRRNVLRDHQALVELFVGNDAVYNMVVTPDTTYFTIINKQAYDSTLNLCINYISDAALQNRDFSSFAQSS
ncbi:MAG TPA: hypothetical protein VEZ17_05160, partial [Chitinophagaceae bacterium]|nr:hypothetical protein [Chitinophagaceae bacterium]